MEEDNLINLLCSEDDVNRKLALSIAHGTPKEYPTFWAFLLRVWSYCAGGKVIGMPRSLEKVMEYHERFIGRKAIIKITDAELDIYRLDVFYNASQVSFMTNAVVETPIMRINSLVMKYQKTLNEDSLHNIFVRTSRNPYDVSILDFFGCDIRKADCIVRVAQKVANLGRKVVLYIGNTPLANNPSELLRIKEFFTENVALDKNFVLSNSAGADILSLPITKFAL